jgi:outer membrane protein assembly factor BamB
LNPETGKELWRRARPSQARAESREAFTTPIPLSGPDRPQIVLAGGDCLTGHDPIDGRELWRWGTWNPSRIGHWRLVPSPVIGGGVVLGCGPKGAPIYAVKTDAEGVLPADGFAWKSEERAVSTDVSTPLFYKGRFYVLNSDRRTLSCVKPASGEVVWVAELDSQAKIEASPTAADGKIYFINHHGDAFVVAAGDEFKLLHKTEMGDEEDRQVRASISISQDRLFIRTERRLYCVGQAP